MKRISKLHFITTSPDIAEQACRGGIDWIQLRLKNVTYADHKSVALEVQRVCKHYNATFIINDNVALALEISADGVHIGKEDMHPDEARAILGENFIIGCTANTFEDIVQLSDSAIDYIGLGPYRFTTTKEKLSPVLGLNGYNEIFTALKKADVKAPPVVGIGGIGEPDVTVLLSAGLHGIAVSAAIGHATDITAAAKSFKNTFNYQLQQ